MSVCNKDFGFPFLNMKGSKKIRAQYSPLMKFLSYPLIEKSRAQGFSMEFIHTRVCFLKIRFCLEGQSAEICTERQCVTQKKWIFCLISLWGFNSPILKPHDYWCQKTFGAISQSLMKVFIEDFDFRGVTHWHSLTMEWF